MSSDEASSGVTYTSISSDYEEPSDVGSLGVVIYGYDGLPMHPVDPPSPDYVPGPGEPEQAPLSPDYVPGPEYPEYLAPSDEEVPIEDLPYAVADSPIALSLGYIAESDLEEDLNDESEDDPADYPADRVDGDDDYDDSSDDNEEEKEASEEEDEEHLAPADPVLTPVVDHVPSSEETEPFETDKSAATPPSPPAGRTTAWMSVRPQTPMPSLSEAEVERLLALPTPPPSPLISLSPSSTEECFARCLAAPALPSPPLPPLPSSLYLPPPVPTSLPAPSPPLPPLPTSLFIPPLVDRKEEFPEVELPPSKRLCLTTPTSRYEVRESSIAAARPNGGHRADYGFIGTLDAETRRQRAKEVGYGIRDVWIDSLIKESRRINRGKSISPRECVVDGVGGFSFSRGLDTVSGIEFGSSPRAGQLSVALGQIKALHARDPTHADDPEGADSCA
ncbi:hypothetical protein Tco_0772090 [Tanacetum coccineum]|uniref:Uncharacterized protein n=1 Tax=Tanacetum coccineum TaxID=301880 RepID=A0ABQ4ZGY1_9ASTR